MQSVETEVKATTNQHVKKRWQGGWKKCGGGRRWSMVTCGNGDGNGDTVTATAKVMAVAAEAAVAAKAMAEGNG